MSLEEKKKANLISGSLRMNERGFGFVVPDEPNIEDIYISSDYLNNAMHNDKVLVRIFEKDLYRRKAEGAIVKIIKRNNKRVTGTLHFIKKTPYVIPDDKRVTGTIIIKDGVGNSNENHDIKIYSDEETEVEVYNKGLELKIYDQKTGKGIENQKVVVEITRWPKGTRAAEGHIVEVLGDKDDPNVSMMSIIKEFQLPEDFPEEVLKQIDKIDDRVREKDLKGRKDLRQVKTITIDGEDAKDLDDAISIEKTPKGYYKLGVHIADVSHYVKENSALDSEALERGTSIYLIDRVIPMLPPKLSNGICSLNKGMDRLAFSVNMTIDTDGNIIDHETFESVIRTSERMTYTDVYKILVEKDPKICKKYYLIEKDIKIMEELALILKEKRRVRGAMDFNFGETKVVLGEDGRVADIVKFNPTIAEGIIEEFMIACNETVAEYFFWMESPFLYRIHEDPDKDKLLAFSKFVRILGYHIKGSGEIHPSALQKLLEDIKGKKDERLVSTMMLRSLQKARYSNQNLGHFGLASKYYCHFTAPIRRYPDLIIHRIMKEVIKGRLKADKKNHYDSILPEIARVCSEKERIAEDVEREVMELKKTEYMEQYLGEEFKGIITGITNFGIFVELDNTVEGIIRLSTIEDDYYVFDDVRYLLYGERTGKQYRIGDIVEVKVVKVDKLARKVEFVLKSKPFNKKDKKRRRKIGSIDKGTKNRNQKSKININKGNKSRKNRKRNDNKK